MRKLLGLLLAGLLVASPALADEPGGMPALYAKEVSAAKVKLYAKDIVGIGKIQFMVNGKEIAWVRAKDIADPKLRFQRDTAYLVRTVNLRPGANRLEILIEGDLAWGRTFNR